MKFLIIPFLLVVFSVKAQTITLLDKFRRSTTDSTKAVYFAKIFKHPYSDTAVVRTYYLDGVKVSEELFSNLGKRIRSGTHRAWHENGKLKHEISYLNNAFHGQLLTYFDNGQLRRRETYRYGKFLEGTCFTRSGSDTAFYDFQTLPQFPGGPKAMSKFLRDNLARPLSTSGMEVAAFTVTPEGKISEIEILKSLKAWHDNEVIRVLSIMPDWKPGEQEGEYFPISYILPVLFTR